MSERHLTYESVSQVAEHFACSSRIREINDFQKVIEALGGHVSRLGMEEWAATPPPKTFSCPSDSDHRFDVSIPAFSGEIEKFLLACSLGHWLLHACDGRNRCSFSKGERSPETQEALWFALALLIPDHLFDSVADRYDDDKLSAAFGVPRSVLAMKRKVPRRKRDDAMPDGIDLASVDGEH